MLPRAIRSVLNQTYQNLEVIVVDDNGIGDPNQIKTSEVLEKFTGDHRVQYVCHETNQGGSQSRNTGAAHGRGEFITFLDDDDEYYPVKLERQLAYYTAHFPNNDGFINAQIDVAKRGRVVRSTRPSVDFSNLLFSAVAENILGTPTFFMPMALFNAVGGFSPMSKGQEWYLSVKLVDYGALFSSMPDPLVRVHIHNHGSITSGHKRPDRLITGLEKIHEIQSRYFNRFTKNQVSEIERNHRLSLTRAHLKYDLPMAAKMYLSSFRFGRPSRQTAILFGIFIRDIIGRLSASRKE